MPSIFRPRRGKKATAESQNVILKKGEIFFETPDTGVGTGIGKIKMGDGTTTYSNLPYFMEELTKDLIYIIKFEPISIYCESNKVKDIKYEYSVPVGYKIAYGIPLYSGTNYDLIDMLQINSIDYFSFRVRTTANANLSISTTWLLVKEDLVKFENITSSVIVDSSPSIPELVLYSNGATSPSVYAWNSVGTTYSNYTASISYGSSSFTINNLAAKYAVASNLLRMMSMKKIDLTNYKTLAVTVAGRIGESVVASIAYNTTQYDTSTGNDYYKGVVVSITSGTFEIDISDMNFECYFGLIFHANATSDQSAVVQKTSTFTISSIVLK